MIKPSETSDILQQQLDNVDLKAEFEEIGTVLEVGDGVANVSDTTINTTQDTSGGIHVAGGGTLHATNLTVETNGGSPLLITLTVKSRSGLLRVFS